MQQEESCDIVRDYLDKNDYRYEYHADEQCLTMDFHLECKLKQVRVLVQFRDDGYLLYGICPVNADPENLGELLKYVAMINWGLVPGNFEVDTGDGEIRSKTWTRLEDAETLSEMTVQVGFAFTLAMFEQFGNGFAALAMGFSDAETEYGKAIGENSADGE